MANKTPQLTCMTAPWFADAGGTCTPAYRAAAPDRQSGACSLTLGVLFPKKCTRLGLMLVRLDLVLDQQARLALARHRRGKPVGAWGSNMFTLRGCQAASVAARGPAIVLFGSEGVQPAGQPATTASDAVIAGIAAHAPVGPRLLERVECVGVLLGIGDFVVTVLAGIVGLQGRRHASKSEYQYDRQACRRFVERMQPFLAWADCRAAAQMSGAGVLKRNQVQGKPVRSGAPRRAAGMLRTRASVCSQCGHAFDQLCVACSVPQTHIGAGTVWDAPHPVVASPEEKGGGRQGAGSASEPP